MHKRHHRYHNHHRHHGIPLTQAPVGKPLQLVKIHGGREITHRLVEMGLTPGSTLKILQNAGGPLLISVRKSRIAIGRGMAFRMRVTIEDAT